MNKIKVLIVDDSAVVRTVLSQIVSEDPNMEVTATASDPLFAREKMKRQWPDVFILDIEMPRMNGIDFLREIMNERPTPCVICSSLTGEGTSASMQAIAAGAISVISKPKMGTKEFLEESAERIKEAVREAAAARVNRLVREELSSGHSQPVTRVTAAIQNTDRRAFRVNPYKRFVVLGASTGGTQAIETILSGLPADCPPIVIVQHMPEKFTLAFANRLNSIMKMEVIEAQTGDAIIPGRVIIAAGNFHLTVNRTREGLFASVQEGPPRNRHRPSVDVMFESVALKGASDVVGVILTGMGDDGSRGMKALRDAGAVTIAQDEATSVVYSMPQEAIRLGGVIRIHPLPKIAEEIMKMAHTPVTQAATQTSRD